MTPLWEVSGSVGTVYATVEASDKDGAMDAAIQVWEDESIEIFAGATMEVRRSSDDESDA